MNDQVRKDGKKLNKNNKIGRKKERRRKLYTKRREKKLSFNCLCVCIAVLLIEINQNTNKERKIKTIVSRLNIISSYHQHYVIKDFQDYHFSQ